jgi:hypothetical protein
MLAAATERGPSSVVPGRLPIRYWRLTRPGEDYFFFGRRGVGMGLRDGGGPVLVSVRPGPLSTGAFLSAGMRFHFFFFFGLGCLSCPLSDFFIFQPASLFLAGILDLSIRRSFLPGPSSRGESSFFSSSGTDNGAVAYHCGRSYEDAGFSARLQTSMP